MAILIIGTLIAIVSVIVATVREANSTKTQPVPTETHHAQPPPRKDMFDFKKGPYKPGNYRPCPK